MDKATFDRVCDWMEWQCNDEAIVITRDYKSLELLITCITSQAYSWLLSVIAVAKTTLEIDDEARKQREKPVVTYEDLRRKGR